MLQMEKEMRLWVLFSFATGAGKVWQKGELKVMADITW